MHRSGSNLCAVVLATIALLGAVRGAQAANAVAINTWDGGLADLVLASPNDAGRALSVAGLRSSMAGNPSLLGSAWAHTGDWWSLYLPNDLAGVRIRVQAQDPNAFSPGISLWAIGGSRFDGGTTGYGGEVSGAGFGTPHSFNATSVLGSNGTLWMQDGQGGNAKELLAYGSSGPDFAGPGGWGESTLHGVHDLSSDTFVASVSGWVGPGVVELQVNGMTSGWYLLYAGGTNHAQAGGLFDLLVVPEPSTGILLALGLGGLLRARRDRRNA